MTLLSRVSAAGSRIGTAARTQFSRSGIANSSKPSSPKNISFQAGGSSSSRLNAIGNVILGTTLVGAGASTVVFTYLRYKNSGFQIGVSANTIMDDGLHPAEYPWPNNHPFATFDHQRYAINSVSEILKINFNFLVCEGGFKSIVKFVPPATLSTVSLGAILSASLTLSMK